MMFPIRRYPHLYEMNTWVWLETLSHKKGQEVRLKDIPDEEWDVLQAHGFDLVWLMGVWKRSPESQRIARTEQTLFPAYERALPGWGASNVVGSPYAVQAYEPDPRIGDWEDLQATRETLHQRGIGLILDFVPNHTARDHCWVRTCPHFYIQNTDQVTAQSQVQFFQPSTHNGAQFIAHGKDPYFPPWTDTAQLNYFNPNTRTALLSELKKIKRYCDGVRCDMAMLILNRIMSQTWGPFLQDFSAPSREFWDEVREAIPELILLAEVYWDLEWELQQLGFDFTYDKRLYDRLRHNNAQGIRDHLTASKAFQSKLVRFLENHDEARCAATFEGQQHRAVLTLMSTLPGMRLYHQGQLDGDRHHIPVQLGTIQPEETNPQIYQWYKTILKINDTPIFHDGMWTLLTVMPYQDDSHKNLIAYSWQLGDERYIVIVNLSPGLSQGRIVFDSLPTTLTNDEAVFKWRDLLSRDHEWSFHHDLRKDGAPITVTPFGSHIFSPSLGSS